MRCLCGYLSGARCRLFAYGPADATASQSPIISCSSSSSSSVTLLYCWRQRDGVREKAAPHDCHRSHKASNQGCVYTSRPIPAREKSWVNLGIAIRSVYIIIIIIFKAHQHKAAGGKTRLDLQNYGCNGSFLCNHGVMEINRISSLERHGKVYYYYY